MNASSASGRMLLAVWMAATGSVLIAAAATHWLYPQMPYGYEMFPWAMFLVTPLVYTILVWREESDGVRVREATESIDEVNGIVLAEKRSVLAWTIPPSVDAEQPVGVEQPEAEIRQLADELEVACQPETISLELFPSGICCIHLTFPDREAAFSALDAAQARHASHSDLLCRVVASTENR